MPTYEYACPDCGDFNYAKRTQTADLRGHYALPLLWRDQAIGWANLSTQGGVLTPDVGFVGTPPKDRALKVALDEELQRMAVFLGLGA